MRDGEPTAKYISDLLECDCSADEAIEIEHYLFSKLSKYRHALERIADLVDEDSDIMCIIWEALDEN